MPITPVQVPPNCGNDLHGTLLVDVMSWTYCQKPFSIYWQLNLGSCCPQSNPGTGKVGRCPQHCWIIILNKDIGSQ